MTANADTKVLEHLMEDPVITGNPYIKILTMTCICCGQEWVKHFQPGEENLKRAKREIMEGASKQECPARARAHEAASTG